MNDIHGLIAGLRDLSAMKHDDLSIGDEAADALERMNDELAGMKHIAETWHKKWLTNSRALAEMEGQEPVARVTSRISECISQGDGTWCGVRIESQLPLNEGVDLYIKPQPASTGK